VESCASALCQFSGTDRTVRGFAAPWDKSSQSTVHAFERSKHSSANARARKESLAGLGIPD
jgi:hypothetical protein